MDINIDGLGIAVITILGIINCSLFAVKSVLISIKFFKDL